VTRSTAVVHESAQVGQGYYFLFRWRLLAFDACVVSVTVVVSGPQHHGFNRGVGQRRG
jgi:hypothetical protein